MADFQEELPAISDFIVVEEGHCAKKVLKGVNNLRETNSYYDITIKVEDKTFSAHKIILAGFSPYFANTISNGCEFELTIDFMTADTFEVIFEYAYTNAITISDTNAERLLRAAFCLEVPHLTVLCAKYLGSRTNCNNYLKLCSIASSLPCSTLAFFVSQYIIKNFGTLAQQDTFLALTPEMLIKAIKSDDLQAPSEDFVLKAVLKWVNHEVDREAILPKVLQFVRLTFVSVDTLNKCTQEESAIRTSAECLYWFSQVLLYKFQPECVTFLPPCFTKLRPGTTTPVITIAKSTSRTGSIAESTPRTGTIAESTLRTGTIAESTLRTGTIAESTLRTGTISESTPSTGSTSESTPICDSLSESTTSPVPETTPNIDTIAQNIPLIPASPTIIGRTRPTKRHRWPGSSENDSQGVTGDELFTESVYSMQFVLMEHASLGHFEYFLLDTDTGYWRHLGKLPENWRVKYHTMAGDKLCVLGSRVRSGSHDTTDFVLQYNLVIHKWGDIPGVGGPVDDVGESDSITDIISLGSQFLYLKRGRKLRNFVEVGYLEQYRIGSDARPTVIEMLVPCRNCFVLPVKNSIFAISTGMSRSESSSANSEHFCQHDKTLVQRFDPATYRWSMAAPLMSRTCKEWCCAFEGKLHVMSRSFDGVKFQAYTVSENKWNSFPAAKKVLESPSALVVMRGRLTILTNSCTKDNKSTVVVEKYISEQKVWVNDGLVDTGLVKLALNTSTTILPGIVGVK